MKKIQTGCFKQSRMAVLVALALAAQFPTNFAHANAGFGVNTDKAGNPMDVPTYYASSPQGVRPAYVRSSGLVQGGLAAPGGATVDTGTPIRKFVDTLGGVYNGLETVNHLVAGDTLRTDLQNGIPVAITEKWFNTLTGAQTPDDYYEIAIVEYTERLHTDLAKATRLRGYVQIETPAIAAGLKDITGLIGSEHIKAYYPDGITPILDANKQQVYFVHKPHYLGPVILAAKGTPVRIKATNYLPYTDKTGKSVGSYNGMGGELSVPVDETIAGGGPVLKADGTPQLDQNNKPIKMAQNRAAIHWHGGDSPWISDGTPHQWFAPAGDISYSIGDALHPVKDAAHPNGVGMGKGDSCADVPDMPASGDGSYTLYFPNNLSGRLMMYHDHTSGLTKVNVYEGMAAGYVVYDLDELSLVHNAIDPANSKPLLTPDGKFNNGVDLPVGLLDAVGIPLVIQDKTFVPKNIALQDAKWDLTHWGQEGDFFFPHVYETNQDPNSIDGTNPVGRWDWGPWFWPVFSSQFGLPSGAYGDANATPEAFMDTPIVNGQPYPTMTVDPKTYRFRILSVANDRTQNLGLYQAVDANGVVCDAATAPALGTPMTGGLPLAACTEVKMVPALPTPGFPATWPTDGRVGGVPDPATAGPDIVQIGSEGGLLPAPAVLKSQPVSYETNVRNITVFNILEHDLLMGGGERADVLIDFSRYAGKTLILYNDAPAPMPGLDPRIDYYTGMGDHTDVGGAYDTLPGYGPNTRTIMQIVVNNTAPAKPLDVAKLAKDLPVTYAKTQPTPIIPEVAYNAPFGTNNGNNYAAIGTGSGGALFGGKNSMFSYTETIGGVATTKQLPVINKAIQELFDPVYGRMNATLAVELPFSTATVATTIPLAYIDTPVENLDAIKDGETQIWKITHNGVDGHPVHFHLVNVQVVNRVAWDGTIRPPEANELGWKETLRMNPLEDVYVAVKAKHPVTPFGLPTSTRLLDPSQVMDSALNFTNIDPTTGAAPKTQTYIDPVKGMGSYAVGGTYTNKLTDFDNEYVWHCHILGHEENDFMRPFIFHPNVVVPDLPTMTAGGPTKLADATDATLTWVDPTPVKYETVNKVLTQTGVDEDGIPTAGAVALIKGKSTAVEPFSNPKNEIGFKVFQNALAIASTDSYTQTVSTVTFTYHKDTKLTTQSGPVANPDVVVPSVSSSVVGNSVVIGTTPANVTSWSGSMPVYVPGKTEVVKTPDVTIASAKTTDYNGNSVWTETTTKTPDYIVHILDTTYSYQAVGYNAAGHVNAAAATALALAVTPNSTLVSAPALTGAAGPTGLGVTSTGAGSATLSWTGIAGATGYLVNGVTPTKAPDCDPITRVCTLTVTGLAAGINNFSVSATTLSGTTEQVTIGLYNGKAHAPVALTGKSSRAINKLTGSSVSLTWANDPGNTNNVTGLALTWVEEGGKGPTGTATFAPDNTGTTVVGLTSGLKYVFTLVANSLIGNSTASSTNVVAK